MLLFFLVSPIRNRFFFESIWKKIFPKSFINNMQYYFVACFIRNLISRRGGIIPSNYNIMHSNYNIYIYKLEPVFLLTEINNRKKNFQLILETERFFRRILSLHPRSIEDTIATCLVAILIPSSLPPRLSNHAGNA